MADRAPRMDQAESDAWLSLVVLLQLLPAALDSQLERDAGMTHFDYLVLSMLRAAPDQSVRAKEIARRTDATLPRVSKVISRLEHRGLVTRVIAADDRRASDIVLSDDGRRAVIRATAKHLAFVRRVILDQLDHSQLVDLASATSKINDQLRSDRINESRPAQARL